MLGTFNQNLPMILSHNFWCQRNPTSLLDTGMDGLRVNRTTADWVLARVISPEILYKQSKVALDSWNMLSHWCLFITIPLIHSYQSTIKLPSSNELNHRLEILSYRRQLNVNQIKLLSRRRKCEPSQFNIYLAFWMFLLIWLGYMLLLSS